MAPLMLATIMVDNGLVPKVCDQNRKKKTLKVLGYFPFTMLTLDVNSPLFGECPHPRALPCTMPYFYKKMKN